MNRITQLPNWDQLAQKLVDEPFALMGSKLDYIIDTCKEHNVKSLLEIGSFAGGSAYVLGKALPKTLIKSIDKNDFYSFFNDRANDNVFDCLDRYFPGLKPVHLTQMQSFYNKQLSNIQIGTGKLKTLDISNYDAIIVDGDHTELGLRSDLKHIIKNNNKCVIFVDDTDHLHIKNVTQIMCNVKKGFNIKYVYKNDSLAIITRRKK